MLEVILDTVIDSVKLIPFLFVTYLIMEYLEHRTNDKTKQMIKNSGKAGPVVGAVLGAFPQCGFSAAASNLYAGRVITLGTLISIYLSTSDEMLPVFISEQVSVILIIEILLSKIVIGMVAGFLIDFVMRKNNKEVDVSEQIGEMCEHDHCHCGEESIIKSSIKHTLEILGYILLISFVLNTLIHFIGEDTLASVIMHRPIVGPLLSALVGMIPNCAASVVIAQLYIEGVMTTGSMMAGLLTGSGIGILVLFRENRDAKENVKILSLVFAISFIIGILIDFVLH